MGAARFLGMVPTMCRDRSPRRSALIEVGFAGLGRFVSAGAVCMFLPGCLSRVRVDHKPSRVLDSSLSVAAAAAVCAPRFASEAKRIGSEAKRSVTPARSFALLCSFHLPALPFRGLLLILPAAILDRCFSSSPAASVCAVPLTPSPNPPGAIFLPAAFASVGYLSRARDSRVRVLDASFRSGCCSGDFCSAADSGCAGSRPLQARRLPLLGLPLAAPRESARLSGWGPGRGTEARSRTTVRRGADGPPAPAQVHCLCLVVLLVVALFLVLPPIGAASPCGTLRRAPRSPVGAFWRLWPPLGGSRPPFAPLARSPCLWRGLCLCRTKRKAPFGASLVRSCSRRFRRRRPWFKRTATSSAAWPHVVKWSGSNVDSLSQPRLWCASP